MKSLRIYATIAIAAIAGVFSSPSGASLLGDTVSCSITPTPFWICTAPTAVVGPGNEFELELPGSPSSFGFFVDLGAFSIAVASNEDNTFGLGANELLTLSSLDAGGAIIGIANFSSSLVTNIDASDVTFTSDSVTINIDSGAFWSPGSSLSFDLVIQAVPEPGTLGALLIGLAGLGAARRRRAAA